MKHFLSSMLLFSILISINSNAQNNTKVVTAFSDNFVGASAEFGVGRYGYFDLVRAGVSSIKSIRVPQGMKATLYAKDNFQGNSIVLTEDANQQFLEAKGFAQIMLNVSLVVEQAPIVTGPAITIYKDDFAGASKSLQPGEYDHYELGEVENDHLSSVKIPKGLKVTLFEHGGFQGRSITLTQDTRASYLVNNNFNDLTSSIRIEIIPEPKVTQTETKPTTVIIITQPVLEKKEEPVPTPVVKEVTQPVIYQGDFSGNSKTLEAGHYSSSQLIIGNNELSSIQVPEGFRVTLYDGDAFEGRSMVLTTDASAAFLQSNGFNNVTSSLIVEMLPMVAIYDGDYSGTQQRLVPGKYYESNIRIGNNSLSSVRVPRGLQVTLYENDSFTGRKLVLTQDAGTDVMMSSGFNNVTSSIEVQEAVIEVVKPMVTLFQDNFSGPSKQLPVGKYSTVELGIGDNTLSSIRIPRGMQVTLYENQTFDGGWITLRKDASTYFLSDYKFNDITSSVLIEELYSVQPVVVIYSDQFSGVSQNLLPGRYLLSDLVIGDNQLSSVKVPKGMSIVMHEDDNFKGFSITAIADKDFTNIPALDNRTSSVIVDDVYEPLVSPVITAPVVVQPVVAKVDSVAKTPPCPAMTSQQFQLAFNTVQAKPFDSDKVEIAKIATKGKCLTNAQIRSIAGLMMSEDYILEFITHAYDYSTEKGEYYSLSDLFKFTSTQERFTDFLKTK